MPIDSAPATETPATTPPPEADAPSADAPEAPKPRGGKNRLRTLERENKRLRRLAGAGDPFAEPVRGAAARPADGPAAEAPAAPEAPPEDSVPPLGLEGAKAMAPAYYGLVNFATSFAIKRAPHYAGRAEEAKRVAKAVALDGSGHYDAAGALVSESADRHAIDPVLIQVLAKVQLTPEWALVIVTAGIVLSKYAMASGDPEVIEVLGAMGGAAAPQASA